MFGWHHQPNEHDFEQTQGDSEGQGSLVCCSSWGHRVRHDLVTKQEQVNLMPILQMRLERLRNLS